MAEGNKKQPVQARVDEVTRLRKDCLFCLVGTNDEISLDSLVPEGQGPRLRSIRHCDIVALIHEVPRKSPGVFGECLDDEHHGLVEKAWKAFDKIIPLARSEDKPCGEKIEAWLAAEYDSLKKMLAIVGGKAEYGIEISSDLATMARRIKKEVPEIRDFNEKAKVRDEISGYVYKKMLNKMVAREMEQRVDGYAKFFFRAYKGQSPRPEGRQVQEVRRRQETRDLSFLPS